MCSDVLPSGLQCVTRIMHARTGALYEANLSVGDLRMAASLLQWLSSLSHAAARHQRLFYNVVTLTTRLSSQVARSRPEPLHSELCSSCGRSKMFCRPAAHVSAGFTSVFIRVEQEGMC